MPKIVKQTRLGKKNKQRKSKSIIGGIMDVADLPKTGVKFLIFGCSGSGKTTLACSFPKPLLMIRPEQVEDGTKSIRTVKGVKATPFLTDADQLAELVTHQETTGNYRTLVLDGFTKYQDLVLKKVLGLKDVPPQLSWGVADQQDWGTVALEFKEYMRELLRLAENGTNIVILGGERAFNTGEEDSLNAPTIMAALTPSTCSWVHEVCDYNVHSFIRRRFKIKSSKISGKTVKTKVQVKGYDYCLHAGPNELYATKFRIPKGTNMPSILVDPDYKNIKKYLV